ncbi:hypothetical protein CR513_27734, partial [Mucuna pruriens]
MKKDSATCYDIESKIFNSKQETFSVTKYYRTLNGLWIELGQYQELKMCKDDSIAYTGLEKRSFPFCLRICNGDRKRSNKKINLQKENPSQRVVMKILYILQMIRTYQGYLLQALWKG